MSDDLTVCHRHGLELPLSESPVKFAVAMPDGTTSNPWRFWIERNEAYVCCRDAMKEIKISLHRSGKQHIAFTSQSGLEMTPGSRFWNQWREPPVTNPATPSFQLVFPPWGIRLTGRERTQTQTIRRRWDDNQILLKGDDEMLVVVSFVILERPRNLNLVGPFPNTIIARLPFGQDKRLFAVAGKKPIGNFKDVVTEALSKIDLTSPRIAREAMTAQAEGDFLTVCLTGDNPQGYAFMTVVPVIGGTEKTAVS